MPRSSRSMGRDVRFSIDRTLSIRVPISSFLNEEEEWRNSNLNFGGRRKCRTHAMDPLVFCKRGEEVQT